MPSGTSSVGSDVPTEIQNQIQTGKPSQEDFNKAIMQILQSKQIPGASGGQPAGVVSEARTPQVQPSGPPQVAGATNPSGVPGAPVSLGQQLPQGLSSAGGGGMRGGPQQFDFATKQGRTASDVSKIGDTLTGILSQAQQRKQKGYENQGYLYTKLYYDAMERGDTQMANAIANDPDIHKVLSKAFGMKEGLPTMGEQKPQKEEKPTPEKTGALRAMMERITGKGKQGQQQQKAPNLPMPQVTPQLQVQNQLSSGMSNVLKGTSEQVAKIGMGLETSPAQKAQAELARQLEEYKQTEETKRAIAVADKSIQESRDRNASYLKVANIYASAGIKEATIRGQDAVEAALARAQLALKNNDVGAAIKGFHTIGMAYITTANDLMKSGQLKPDDPLVKSIMDQGRAQFDQASVLVDAAGFAARDKAMNKALPVKPVSSH